MSEFTQHKNRRVEELEQLFYGILKGENLRQLIDKNQNLIDNCIPSDVIYLVDNLVIGNVTMPDLKRGINKLLNLLYKTISSYPYYPPNAESYLGVFIQNNSILDEKLKAIKPLLREINIHPEKSKIQKELKKGLREIEVFLNIYAIKENVLFPVIENYIPEFRCLKVMWSFHDDIKRKLKEALAELEKKVLNLKLFNRLSGDLFFAIYAIRFREERILYPMVQSKVPEKVLNSLFKESKEIGFPFYQPALDFENNLEEEPSRELINLETGSLSVEQIKLLFNHLPVDITFVDENNKVKYFSTPKKRIFRRTKSIIGRDVHNCHPPESVHVVEQIVESFKSGKKDSASFWINLKGEQLLIQYFALRDEAGNYKGVVEVSQEISEIKSLQGEKRLLDWED